MPQSHSAQYMRRFGELNIVIADDLDPVAPRVEEVEKRTRKSLDAGVGQRLPNGLLVIDDESEMTAAVGGLRTAFLERKELVAQVDKGRGSAFAPKLKIEQATIESQSGFDVTDLERDVIETDGARLL